MASKKHEIGLVSDIGVPLRKRTEKACDPCRRRKTKCNGTSPCKACIEIGLDCSYGNRIKQTRGPQYVAYLENRLKMLESEDEHRKKLTSWRTTDRRDSLDHSRAIFGQQSPEISSPTSSSSYSSGPSQSSQQSIPKTPPGHLEPKCDEQHLKRRFADDGVQSPQQRKRSASEVLTDAQNVLDQLSQTNQTAAYAAECIRSLGEDPYQEAPALQPAYDFTLIETDNSFATDLNVRPHSFNSKQLMNDANLDLAQVFAPNSQPWPNSEHWDYF